MGGCGAVLRQLPRLAAGMLGLWGVAQAQEASFDPQRLRPHTDAYGYSVVGGTSTLGHLQVGVGLWGQLEDDSLVLTDDRGDRVYLGDADTPGEQGDGVLDRRGTSHFQLGLGLGRFFSLSMDLPVVLWQEGFDLRHLSDPTAPRDLRASGVGDLRVVPKFTLVDLGASPVGLALWGEVTAPTGPAESYLGEGGWTVTPTLAVELADGPVRTREHVVRGALNVGYRFRTSPVAYDGVDLDQELLFAGALAVQPSPLVELGVEVVGALARGQSDVRPLEVLPSLKLTPGQLVTLTAGAGFGLLGGAGSPDYRVFLGGTLQPSFDPRTRDRDKDGVPNRFDACPDDPEDVDGFEDADGCPDPDNDGDGVLDLEDACPGDPEDVDGFEDADGCPDPDNDGDGLVDVADRCPNEPEVFNDYQDSDGCPDERPILDSDGDGYRDEVDGCPNEPEDYDRFADADGCPDLDNDGDGFLDVNDACPRVAEDFDGIDDSDGCPDLDGDGDGIADVVDACPREPETVNGFQDDDGCPDERPATRVVVRREALEIADRVHFEVNEAVLDPRSFELLDEIATVILDHPELLRLRIEGHTDSDGTEAYNLDLSQRRAQAVLDYLVARGVSIERLLAEGFGEGRPRTTNDTWEGRATNRRVEFIILERAD